MKDIFKGSVYIQSSLYKVYSKVFIAVAMVEWKACCHRGKMCVIFKALVVLYSFVHTKSVRSSCGKNSSFNENFKSCLRSHLHTPSKLLSGPTGAPQMCWGGIFRCCSAIQHTLHLKSFSTTNLAFRSYSTETERHRALFLALYFLVKTSADITHNAIHPLTV